MGVWSVGIATKRPRLRAAFASEEMILSAMMPEHGHWIRTVRCRNFVGSERPLTDMGLIPSTLPLPIVLCLLIAGLGAEAGRLGSDHFLWTAQVRKILRAFRVYVVYRVVSTLADILLTPFPLSSPPR